MKLNNYSSILSCIPKCIRILPMVIKKKTIIGFLTLIFLGACTTPTAMIGPAYTLTSSGNVLQAGFSYGSSELITSYTGKTPIENLEEITLKRSSNKKNIQKQTLESDEFYHLVKNRIKKTNSIIKSSNQ